MNTVVSTALYQKGRKEQPRGNPNSYHICTTRELVIKSCLAYNFRTSEQGVSLRVLYTEEYE